MNKKSESKGAGLFFIIIGLFFIFVYVYKYGIIPYEGFRLVIPVGGVILIVIGIMLRKIK